METVTIKKINETLQKLPNEKLTLVYDFISYLFERDKQNEVSDVMYASEEVLKRDWLLKEEDEAWANL